MITARFFTRRMTDVLGALFVAVLMASQALPQEVPASARDDSRVAMATSVEQAAASIARNRSVDGGTKTKITAPNHAGQAKHSMTRKGKRYTTTVERRTEGTLSNEDFQQVSLLATRIVKHMNAAVEHLVDEHHDKARSELQSLQTLSRVARDILPVTIVDTVVTNADGEEIYRNSDRVQDDLIPIFENRVAVEVMEPILDAKKESAAVKGIRLADADLIHTSVLLDLSYVDRKVKRCLSLLDEDPDRALSQLVLAQNDGVRLSLHKEDHPLVEAQAALRVAQRMVEQERYDAGKANLMLARNHLELYRGLSRSADEKVKEMDRDIEKVMEAIEEPGAADKIGGFWGRLTEWFTKEAGVMRATESASEQTVDK